MAQPLPIQPLSDDELQALQALLDTLPESLDSLDVVMVDGYLCGVLLQPQPVAEALWLPRVVDADGRPAPAGFDWPTLGGWLRRRREVLNQAIAQRRWFDPWVFELDADASPSDAVLPWVAGFALAMDVFPQLLERHEPALLEPLATLYRHLDPQDLEDADALLAEIESLAPPESLAEAVEDLVRSVLLIADVSRPHPAAKRVQARRTANGAGGQTTPRPGRPRR